MPRIIVCDVNETLLDVGALEPHFKDVFGDIRLWTERIQDLPRSRHKCGGPTGPDLRMVAKLIVAAEPSRSAR